jgi:hypothetical protein
MRKYFKLIRTGISSDETGFALIIVLVLLLLGSLTIMPVLAHLSNALKSGKIYEEKSNELYAADAGVEDAIWRIKYDFLGVGYDEYDYETVWSYETDSINGIQADVTIQNIWVPAESAPNAALARSIIESEKLVVVGTAGGSTALPYSIKIEYTPAEGDNLTVKSLGVWLPQGYTYEEESCSLFPDEPPPLVYTPDSENISDSNGGQAVVWYYNEPYPLFIEFPGVDSEAATMSLEFDFEYNPPADHPNRLPAAIAWITTEMALGCPNPDIPISWDVDTRIFKITSEAGDTSIQAYSSKCELRQLGDAISGDYVAIGNSLMTDDHSDYWDIRDTWHESSSFTLTTVPEDGDALRAYLYWAGWRNNDRKVTHFSDDCTNLDTNWTYGSPTSWSVDSDHFKAEYTGGGDAARLLSLKTAQDLSGYAPGSIILTWEQSTDETTVYSEPCNNLDDWDYGAAWDESQNHFRARSGTGPDDPARLLELKDGTKNLEPYAGQTINISWDVWETDWHLGSDEGLDYAFSSDNGSSWSDYEEVFRDDIDGTLNFSTAIPGAYLTSGFKVRFKLVGFTGSDYCYIDDIKINTVFSPSCGIDFALSDDGGSTWSDYIEAFRGDLGSSANEYIYYLPSAYQTSNFMFRLKVVGGSADDKISIDDIKILNLPPDTSVDFTISDGTTPHTENITAERSYVMYNTLGGPEGFSYACVSEVTDLVQTYPVDEGEEHHTGNAIYTVANALADINSNLSFAGWSLIVIYTSPETAGHYLYLRDTDFTFHTGNGESLDFDDDGIEGGYITDFVIPEPITDKFGEVIETVAAKVTCFVAEGDEKWTGDYIEITGQQSGQSMKLSNDQSPETNVWNGKFPPLGSTWDGVDIDTFEILWDDNILTPGDSMLEVDMVSPQDAWNLVYFIVSIRSETVTGGTSHYMISGP